MNADKPTCEAAARLLSPEMAPFMRLLADERSRTLEHLAEAPAEVVGKLQGRAQAFKAIMDFVESAPAALTKMAGRKAHVE